MNRTALDKSRRDFFNSLPLSEAAKKTLMTPDGFTTDHACALAALTTYGHIIRHNTTVKSDFTPVVTASAVMAVFDILSNDGIIEWLSEIGGRVTGGAKAKRQLAMEGGAKVAWNKVEAVMVLMSYVASKRPAVIRDIAAVLPSFRPWRELLVEIDTAETYNPESLAALVGLMQRTRVGATSPDVKRVVDAVGRESVLAFNGSNASVSNEPTSVPSAPPADDGTAVADYVLKLTGIGMSGEDATRHAEALIRAIHDRDAAWLTVAMNGSSGLPNAPLLAGYARALWSRMTGLDISTDPAAVARDLSAWAASGAVEPAPETNPTTAPPVAVTPPASSPVVPTPPADEKFKAKYGVNDEQARIIEDRSPFVVVPAAAGSGKTRTVTNKIKYLTEECGVHPKDIRIVAFNKHASIEIASRLRTMIGHDNTKSVDPMTTHKFASKYGFLTPLDIDATVFPSGTPRIKSGQTVVFLPSQPDLLKAAYSEAVDRANIKPGEMDLNLRVVARFIDNYKNFGMTLTEYMRQWYPQREDPRVRFLMLATLLYEEQKGYTARERTRYGAEYDRLESAFMVEPKNTETEQAWRGKVRNALGEGALTIRHDLTDWVSEMYEAVTPKEYDDARARAGKEARLRRLQDQHKVLIVDESQDLAPVQVLLYRAIGMNRTTPGAQYIRVGDDAQCVDGDTLVTLKENGVKVQRAVRDVKTGDRVLAWSVGRRKFRRVTKCWKTTHTMGYRVHTESGKTLLMSPNHKIYAALPKPSHRWFTYLMYREDMGFRIGITQLQNSQGVPFARANQEMADCVWLVGAHDDCESALLQETQLSLKYSIPTYVFYSRTGTDQSRINAVFREFGANGARLLKDIGASVDHPCWISGGTTRGRTKRRVNLLVHGSYKDRWEKHEVVHESEAGRIRRNFNNYDTAVMEAQKVAEQVGARVSERLYIEGVKLYLTTACCVQPGTRLHTVDGIETVKSVSIEAGEFYDLDVDGSRNFFGNGILSHNSIYGFRGATPEEFVSDSRQPGAQQLSIASNYRSYAEIVTAADRLVNNNQVQIAKQTIAARGPGGTVSAKQGGTFDSIVTAVVDRVEEKLVRSGGQYLDPTSKRPLYAITCRTRRELDEFEDELAIRDITYVRKGGAPFWLKGDVGGVVRLMAAAYCYAGKISIPARDQLEILSKIIQWPFRPGAPKTGALIFYEPFAKSANPIQALKGVNKLGDVYYDRAKGGGRSNYDHFPTFIALRNDLERIMSKSPNLNDMLMAILEGESRGYDGDSVADLLVKATMSAADDDVEEADDEADAIDAGPNRAGGVAVFDKIARFAERLGLTDNPQGLIEAIRERTAAARRIAERIEAGDQEAIPAVSLSTIHMTKGLEFENVFMVANAHNFPAPVRDTDALLVNQQRVAQYPGGLAQLKMEEERRLAYVAMTRAISNLEIYTSRFTINGKETDPSPFITEAGIPVTPLSSAPATTAESVPSEVLPPVSESAVALAASLGF